MKLKLPNKERFSTREVIKVNGINQWGRATHSLVEQELDKMGLKKEYVIKGTAKGTYWTKN